MTNFFLKNLASSPFSWKNIPQFNWNRYPDN